MKTIFKTLTFLLFVLTFTNCEYYESKVPISNSKNSNIDSTYIGIWQSVSEIHLIIEVTKLNKNQYIISGTKAKADCKDNYISLDNGIFTVHNTKINEQDYFNIRQLNRSSSDYGIGKVLFENDTLYIYGLSDSFNLPFEKSKLFSKHVKNNQKEFDSKFKLFGKFIKSNGTVLIKD